MFAEFGQAPLSLDIDLDSYEGSWTHVAGFRGGGGWLHVSRATIQSEHDLLRADLIAACDEQGNAIPAWRAVHLTQCGWSRLEPCYDEPPALLDDLLCEEEGGFYARWQREMNADLALLFDAAQRQIEALEAKTAARTRAVERQIADLRRRRRMPECSVEARIALGAVIADLEAENDAAIASLADQRTRLRRQAEAAEEALWQRSDVLIEIEPRFTVRWQATAERQGWRYRDHGSGGIGLTRLHSREIPELNERRRKQQEELERFVRQRSETRRAEAKARSDANAAAPHAPVLPPDARKRLASMESHRTVLAKRVRSLQVVLDALRPDSPRCSAVSAKLRFAQTELEKFEARIAAFAESVKETA